MKKKAKIKYRELKQTAHIILQIRTALRLNFPRPTHVSLANKQVGNTCLFASVWVKILLPLLSLPSRPVSVIIRVNAEVTSPRPGRDGPSRNACSLPARCHALTGLQRREVQAAPSARGRLATVLCAYKMVSHLQGASHCRANGW